MSGDEFLPASCGEVLEDLSEADLEKLGVVLRVQCDKCGRLGRYRAE